MALISLIISLAQFSYLHTTRKQSFLTTGSLPSQVFNTRRGHLVKTFQAKELMCFGNGERKFVLRNEGASESETCGEERGRFGLCGCAVAHCPTVDGLSRIADMPQTTGWETAFSEEKRLSIRSPKGRGKYLFYYLVLFFFLLTNTSSIPQQEVSSDTSDLRGFIK